MWFRKIAPISDLKEMLATDYAIFDPDSYYILTTEPEVDLDFDQVEFEGIRKITSVSSPKDIRSGYVYSYNGMPYTLTAGKFNLVELNNELGSLQEQLKKEITEENYEAAKITKEKIEEVINYLQKDKLSVIESTILKEAFKRDIGD